MTVVGLKYVVTLVSNCQLLTGLIAIYTKLGLLSTLLALCVICYKHNNNSGPAMLARPSSSFNGSV